MGQSDAAQTGRPRPTGRTRAGRTRATRRTAPGRLAGLAALSAAGCLIVAACSGAPSASAKGSGKAHGSGHQSSGVAASVQLSISPGNGTRQVNPSNGVKVTAAGGKIQSVSVSAGHSSVAGTLNAGHTTWQSTWALQPGTSYTVHATAVDSGGKTVSSTSSFHTLTPGATDTAMIFEGYQQTYGVGMPIRITFSSPVTNKAGVERSLQVTSSRPVTGAWYWDGNQTLYFRPMNYWPAHTTVSFDGHLNGVQAAPGVFFTADLTQTFQIGDSLISVVNTRTHYANIYYQGRLWGHWPVSTGAPGMDTVDGTYITLEKGNPTRMIGNGYNELVNYAVRFTYSGDYMHSAPWSVSEQGYTNVSHGCVNLSPQHAAMYYNLAVPGDPVTIINSPAAGQWGDGFTVWFLSWPQLLKGSATGQAVQAGPSGSTFVSPSAVTQTPQTGILTGAAPGNSNAQ